MALVATYAYSQDFDLQETVIRSDRNYYGNSLSLEGDVLLQNVTCPEAYDGPMIQWFPDAGVIYPVKFTASNNITGSLALIFLCAVYLIYVRRIKNGKIMTKKVH